MKARFCAAALVLVLSFSVIDATLFGWGNRDRLAQSTQTYSLDTLILRTMAQNNVSAGELTGFLGSPTKTLICNDEIYVLTSSGYVHRIGYNSVSVSSTGQIIRILNYQNSPDEVDYVVDIVCSSSKPTPIFAVTKSGLLFSWGDVSSALSIPVEILGSRSTSMFSGDVAAVLLPDPGFPNVASVVKVSVSTSTVFVLMSEGKFVPLGFCGIWCLMNTTSEVLPNSVNPTSIALGIPGEFLVDVSLFHDQSQQYLEPFTSHSIFCTASGKVFTAGFANKETLLVYGATDSFVPIEVPSLGYCRKVFASRYASTVITSNGRVWSAGSAENSGQGIPNVSPRFIASALDGFPLFSENAEASFLIYGRGTTNFFVSGWGPSALINRWAPLSTPAREPTILRYISADSGGQLSHCSAASSPLSIAICTTASGKITMWSNEIQRINFTERFGIAQPDPSTTPSVADLRQTIPLRNIIAMHDENPHETGRIVVQYSPTFETNGTVQSVSMGYLPSGRSSSEASITPVFDRIRSVSISCMVAYTVVVTDAGQTFYTARGLTGFLPLPTETFFELTAFSTLEFAQVVAFTRRRRDPQSAFQWIDYAETRVDAAMETIGHLGLTVDNRLFWTNRAPIDEWESGMSPENISAANIVDMNALFASATPPTLQSIHGKYDWFFLVDSNNETWTFGDSHYGCGCQAASNSTISVAVKVTVMSRIQWIFPLVKYFDSNMTILQYVEDDVERGTVFVSNTQIRYCGSPSIWPNLNNMPLPQSCNESNPIVKASFSALTGLIQLRNGELWSIGAPDGYPVRNWTRYDQFSILRAKNFAAILALDSGGAAVSSFTSVQTSTDRRILRSQFERGEPLTIFGTSLGESGDNQIVAVYCFIGASRVPLDVLSRQTTEMTVFPTSLRSSDRAMNPGPLVCDISISGTDLLNSTIGIVVDDPALQQSILPGATLFGGFPGIAQNADSLTISGTELSAVTRIELLPSGNCRSFSGNATTATCFLSGDSFAAIPPGFRISARVYSGDLIINSEAFTLYTVVPKPSVAVSSGVIPLGAVVLNISGSGFDPNPYGNIYGVNQVLVRINQGEYVPCVVLEGATNTSLSCAVPSNETVSVPGAIVTAIVRSYNGNSDPVAIGTVATLPEPIASVTNAGSQNSPDPASNIALIASVSTVAAVIAISAAIVLAILVRRRNQLRDIKGASQQIPAEMAAMFNIKSLDLELVKKLGEGSFGAVWLCRWKQKDGKTRFVAVKKLISSMMNSHVNDFFREATLMTGILPHKNVVKIHGLCQEQSNFSLVMEYVSIGALDFYIQNRVYKPNSEDARGWDKHDLHRIVLGVARGMAHLASQGVVHRDLAARNVLLGNHCEPKISDFGMSRMVGADTQTGQTNSTVGPIKWMPPESLSNREYSEKSDVWAYGVTLFEITTGMKPFGDEDLINIVLDVRDRGRTVLSDLQPDVERRIPKYILRVMQKCFILDPRERPSFAEIEKMLSDGAPSGYKEANTDEGGDEFSDMESLSPTISTSPNYQSGALSHKEKSRSKPKKSRKRNSPDPWQQEETPESALELHGEPDFEAGGSIDASTPQRVATADGHNYESMGE